MNPCFYSSVNKNGHPLHQFESAFHITGPCWVESIDHWSIPSPKPELWCFRWLHGQATEQRAEMSVLLDAPVTWRLWYFLFWCRHCRIRNATWRSSTYRNLLHCETRTRFVLLCHFGNPHRKAMRNENWLILEVSRCISSTRSCQLCWTIRYHGKWKCLRNN